jgi:hypothetical protein
LQLSLRQIGSFGFLVGSPTLFLPLQFPLSPVRVFAIGIELPNDVTVQCPQDADARHHGRAVVLDDQEHRFNCGLPFRELLFGLGKLLDIFGGVLEGDKLAATGQRDGIVERAFPTPVANAARPSCRTRF